MLCVPTLRLAPGITGSRHAGWRSDRWLPIVNVSPERRVHHARLIDTSRKWEYH